VADRIRTSVGVSAAALGMIALGAGCAANHTPARPSAGPSAARPGATSPVTGSATGCATGAWQTVPLAVTHSVAVPPVPVLTSVRTAQHPECGYDRLVLDLNGPLPSYSIRSVARITADASGQPIALPGQQFLLITLNEAQAHSAAGTPTISGQIQLPGYPALRSWVLAGDNEGVVTIAVGLPGQVSVRTGELPGHLYIDLKE
jgi:hypothetical protein